MQQHYSVYIKGNYVSRHRLLSEAKKKAMRELEKQKGKATNTFILSGPGHPFTKYEWDAHTGRWYSEVKKI